MINEIFMDRVPGFDDENIIDRLESDEPIFLNLVDTEYAYSPTELEHLSSYGEQISGLSIGIDCCDEEELSPLWAFHRIKHLRIHFSDTPIGPRDFGYLLSLLSNFNSLTVLILETLPFGGEDYLSNLASTITIPKSQPITLALEKPRGPIRGKKVSHPQIPELSRLQVLYFKRRRGSLGRVLSLNSILESKHKTQKFEAKEMQYSGSLIVEDNEWDLEVKSINIDPLNEVVVSFEGVDEDGDFSCAGRCLWNDKEGGFFFGRWLPIHYRDYTGEPDKASVRFSEFSFSPDGSCMLSGEWMQNGGNWKIEGKLDRVRLLEQVESLKKSLSAE